MQRVMVFNRLDAYRFDLDPAQTRELSCREEINGEHSLTITTTQPLEKTDRIVAMDGTGRWQEWVVCGIEELHDGATYYAVWSLQYDLSATFVDNMYGCGVRPGKSSIPHPVEDGLTIALSSTIRWDMGTVDVDTEASASFYRMSGWEGIQRVVERWGGEVRATIEVSYDGVTARHVDLLAHLGSPTPARRFDYGHDVSGIKRTVADDVWPCRIVPLGASQETEAGGYTRRPDISSVNGGVMWLQDDTVVDLVKIPDGEGGWEYPTAIVRNDTYEEPADVKAWALEHIEELTRPIVSYEVEVAQTTQAGMGPLGVGLGDEVVVVDRDFLDEGLRIAARVVKIEQNLLDPSDVKLTLGNAQATFADQFTDITRQLEEVEEQVSNASSWQSTADYVSALLGRLNTEANALGGYTYITEGQGLRTYDVAVTDPLVGTEASKVVEIKGGTIRIANSKDAQGNWEWKTLITAGVVNSELIRAIESGDGWITQMTSQGMEVLNGATSQAFFGATTRIGPTASNRVEIDSTGVQFFLGNNSYADMGPTIIRLGAFGGAHFIFRTTSNALALVMIAKDASEALVIRPESMTISAADSATGQDETAYGSRFGNGRDSFLTMVPATARDANGKLYFTDEMKLHFEFASTSISGGLTRINDGLYVSGGATIYGGLTLGTPLPAASGGTGIADYGAYQVNDDSTGVSVANNAWRTVNQLTLAAGRWLLRYDVEFDSDATGYRGCGISTASGSISAANLRQSGVTVPAANGAGTRLNGSRIVNPTSSTTYYLVVRQNSGSALNTTSYIQAVKIG